MKEQPFWMVWCETGGAPTRKHPSQGSAATEAQRLARVHRGEKFIVLRSVSAFLSADTLRIDYEVNDDVPAPF